MIPNDNESELRTTDLGWLASFRALLLFILESLTPLYRATTLKSKVVGNLYEVPITHCHMEIYSRPTTERVGLFGGRFHVDTVNGYDSHTHSKSLCLAGLVPHSDLHGTDTRLLLMVLDSQVVMKVWDDYSFAVPLLALKVMSAGPGESVVGWIYAAADGAPSQYFRYKSFSRPVSSLG